MFQATKSKWESDHRCGAHQINHTRDEGENQAECDARVGGISDARFGYRTEIFADSCASDHLARAPRSMLHGKKLTRNTED